MTRTQALKNQKKGNTYKKNGLPDFSVLGHWQGMPIPPEPRMKIIRRLARKFVKISVYIGVPLYIFFHYFYYIDIPNSCYISIRPSFISFSNLEMKRGLNLLKQDLPENYLKVCANVNSIDPNFGCGGFGGGCFFPNEQNSTEKGMIAIGTIPGNAAKTAAAIIHETCHAIQYHEYRAFNEKECYTIQDEAYNKLTRK